MANINIPDSALFQAGAGPDLKITHDGSNSTISNATGTLTINNIANANMILGTNNTTAVTIGNDQSATFAGNLTIPEYIYHTGDTDTFIRFIDGGVAFSCDNTTPLVLDATSGTGMAVAGNATFAGALTANGTVTFNTADSETALTFTDAGTNAMQIKVGAGDEIYFGSNNTYQIQCNTSGNVATQGTWAFTDALDVSGTQSSTPYIYAHGQSDDFNVEAVKGLVTGTDGDNTGGHFSATGSSDKNIGVYATATSATANYAGIFEAGHVGIGTVAPTSPLHVSVTGASRIASFYNDGGDAAYEGINLRIGHDTEVGNTWYLECDDGNGQNAGGLQNVWGTMTLQQTSDIRLKKDIVDTATKGLETVNDIKVRDFKMKKSGVDRYCSFIANELNETFPVAVTGEPDAMKDAIVLATHYKDGDEMPEGKKIGDIKTEETTKEVINPLLVSNERLVPLLVKAVQELTAKVTALENA